MIENVPFALRATLATTVKTLAVPAHDKGLELICDLPCGVPDRLIGDPLRLRQVLMNLLGNAIKFTHRGEVVLRVRVLSEIDGQAFLEFAVSDTGIGISPEDQEKIFTPFTQVDASTSRRYGGTGLGLSIASNLAAMMGGHLRVHSDVGQGSTFFFAAPFARQSGDDPAGRLTPPDCLRAVSVFLVEPNRSSRQVFEAMLHDWGIVPQLTADLPTVLDRLRAADTAGQPAPLVIVDGLAWAEELVAAPDLPSGTKVIVLLSSTDRQKARTQDRAGKRLFLEKPVMDWELLAALAKLSAGVRETQRSSPPAPTSAIHPLRILLAEDTTANQKVVTVVLSKRGHHVDVAPDGQQALELLDRNDYDLVLMDVQMPVMDGFQATAAIRSLHDTAKAALPIVALTAHAMKGDADRCLAAGMNAYIAKPIDAGELVDLVERLAH